LSLPFAESFVTMQVFSSIA